MLLFNRKLGYWVTSDKRFTAQIVQGTDQLHIVDLDTYNETNVASLLQADDWVHGQRNNQA